MSSRELTHKEIEALLGAYALDAVDDRESDAIEVHLRGCPRCRAEVADHREVAARMAYTGSPAPQQLWDRIQESLEESPPAPEFGRVVQLRPARSPGRALRMVASIAAAVVIGGLGVRVVHDSRRIDQLAPRTQQAALLRAANSALVDPHARRVSLRSTDGKLQADAVVLADGAGYLVKGNLPSLRPDETYQLWALMGTSKISAGVLGQRLQPTAFRVAGDIWGLALTKEHAGGVTATQNQPLVVGQFRAPAEATPTPA